MGSEAKATVEQAADEWLFEEVYDANVALQQCLFDAGDDETKKRACVNAFRARMDRAAATVRTVKPQ